MLMLPWGLHCPIRVLSEVVFQWLLSKICEILRSFCYTVVSRWVMSCVPVRNLLNTSVQSLFLNSVPLSVSIFFDGPNTQQMLSVYAFITSSSLLDLIRMQKVNPVSMHTAISAYLFPLLEGGWNSPIKSMAMNSIGCGGTLKCSFWICCTFILCFAHVTACVTVSLDSLFHAFPMV